MRFKIFESDLHKTWLYCELTQSTDISNSMCTSSNWVIRTSFFRAKSCDYKLHKIIILVLTLTKITLKNWGE